MRETRSLAVAGILSGLSFALMFLEFPVFPQASFLKYDPSEIPALIAALAMGSSTGVAIILVKDVLFYFAKSGDLVGIAMNAVAGVIFVLVAPVFRANTTSKKVIASILSSLVVAAVMTGMNAFVVPLYFKAPFDLFLKFLPFIIAFNVVKFASDYLIGVYLYERTKGFFQTR